jgi:molecular chaperone DnaJ
MADYYAVLGVNTSDSGEVIKKRFRELAIKYHPDKNPDNIEESERRFKEVNDAYQVLGNEEKRKKYDEQRSAHSTNTAKKTNGKKKGEVPVGEVNLSDLMGKFDNFFGKAMPNPAKSAQANPLDASQLFEKFMGLK